MQQKDPANDRQRQTTSDDGKPVYDPSSNVFLLVEAANKRQDDLRVAEMRRLEDLRLAESKRVDEVAALRAQHAEALNLAESKRIDAIRAVDVAAVATASDRASQQATVLANQVSASAEALRTLVATTAQTQATAAGQLATQIMDRIALLERAQYKGEGRSGVADPALVDLINEVKGLRLGEQRGSGQREGIGLVGTVIAAAVALLVGLLTMWGALK